MPPFRLPRAVGAVALLTLATMTALVSAGCSPQDEPKASPSTSAGPAAAPTCTPAGLDTMKSGKLTIGTDKPAYAPWFSDDKPSNGKGYESAVAYAVAAELGYDKSAVTWVTASFNSVIQPGPKYFDLDINQFSITPEREKAVDFSSGYYDVTQAVVTTKGSKADGVKDLAGLKNLKIGAQVGTTSYRAVTDVIAPAQAPAVFDDNDKAKLALANGQIDALVVDLPTALYLAAADLKNGTVVGQLPPTTSGTVEQFGIILAKNSPLTPCVSRAVDTLRTKGTLKELQATWLTEAAGAPELK
jgi:polar amino acid transport system substrate-binding protein